MIDRPSFHVKSAPSHLSLLENDGWSLNLVPLGSVSQDGLRLLQPALGDQPAWGLGDKPAGGSVVKGHRPGGSGQVELCRRGDRPP